MIRGDKFCSSREQCLHHLATVELDGAVDAVVDFAGGFEAEGVIDRGADIVRGIRCRGGVGADLVRLANHLAAANPGTREQAEEARRQAVQPPAFSLSSFNF